MAASTAGTPRQHAAAMPAPSTPANCFSICFKVFTIASILAAVQMIIGLEGDPSSLRRLKGLDDGTQAPARSMTRHARIGCGNPENATDSFVRQTVDVNEIETSALGGSYFFERLVDDRLNFLGGKERFRGIERPDARR